MNSHSALGRWGLELEGLDLEELFDTKATELAAVARLLVATERAERVEPPAVDLDHPRAHPAGERQRAVLIAGPNRARSTSSLVCAVHVCPPLMKQLVRPTLMAFSKSASGSTTLADFPPSSSATRLIVPLASSLTRRPARVEPVNETMSTSGCAAS